MTIYSTNKLMKLKINIIIYIIMVAVISCSGHSNSTNENRCDSIHKDNSSKSEIKIENFAIFSSPWTKTKPRASYAEMPAIEYLPVDESNRTLYDTCIVARKEHSYNGHNLIETRYWLYPANTKSSDSNYEMRCFSYMDTTICKFTCGGVDQIILNTPEKFEIIDLKYVDHSSIYKLYDQYGHIPDSLIRYMRICMAELPDAKFSKSGIADESRNSSWKAQFNKSVSLNGISLNSTTDKNFVYTIKFPFRSSHKSTLRRRLAKMPPFLISDFESYVLNFTDLYDFDHEPTDFSQYDD